MYLAIVLIILSLVVFYNEFTTKMHLAELALLFIGLIAIIRAAYNYIQIDSITEGFTSYHRKARNNKKQSTKNTVEEMQINSEDSNEYLDTDSTSEPEKTNSNMNIEDIKKANKQDNEAIKKVDELLGKNISKFNDVETPTTNTLDKIDSTFIPQILIGQGGQGSQGSERNSTSSWKTVFTQDGMKFDDTMKPTHNLWSDQHSYYNGGSDDNWTQNMDAYNKGRWRSNLYKRPSDYVDYYNPESYGTNTPSSNNNNNTNNTRTDKKMCGPYDNLDTDQAGNLVVKEYKYSKTFMPGYTYVPPSNWDVPQKHISNCLPEGPSVRKLTGLIDRGLPLNVLELNPNGSIANTEETVNLTNVGSLMPKFSYQEEPYSKPYV
jgi:hypothetical protein